MRSITLEVTGDDAADVDQATSTLLEQARRAGASIEPAPQTGPRDGGIIALTIAVLGGAASLAQVAATIHALRDRKGIQVVVIDRRGTRRPVIELESTDEIAALFEGGADDDENST